MKRYEVADIEDRPPIGWMNYNGNAKRIIEDGDPQTGQKYRGAGPTYTGEIIYPVTVEYDPTTNKSRVGFSYQMPPEMEEMFYGKQ